MNLLYANDATGQYPNSWYAATSQALDPFPKLKGSHHADVCVIGGGFTGLSTALHLAERGYTVSLIEAHRVGWGASGRNGGQVGSGQRAEQDELEKTVGLDDAKHLWRLAEDAKALVKSLSERHAIDCAHKPGVAHVEWHAKNVPELHAYTAHLEKTYDYTQIQNLDRAQTCDLLGTEVYHGGALDMGAAHIHPLNFALGLARAAHAAGVQIYETSEVTKIDAGDPATVVTARGTVTAAHVVLACNGYLGGLNEPTAARVMPINNFIVATEPLDQSGAEALIKQDVAIADSKFVVNYYRRSADHRLLFGGGESYGYKFPRDIRALVSKPMLQVYPQLKDVKLDYAWGGTLAITINRMPYFDRIRPNIFTASGYSGHGVALATLAGKITAAAIAGQAEDFDVMSRVPTHRFPGGRALRSPALKLAMTWYAMRDRLGI
ncbi:FAD-binding oxidoreductase [Amylibacter sp. IMCC11727]|uniref:NAD(P)/FAD-dependent oxidoreductase n=1 Tax=Amylibacter sp. IMCC11727 TaxID=3039851 RepID=UPI00244DF3A3|nr:FAD-binding oxidoreductase [Amylibacter sp. IMCC11727]WGI20268.1 FAD-binding oxidoreductase [Amylibacter sp. IMCC11727]